jgi:putative transposase
VRLRGADAFAHPTTAPNQLWQTDLYYLRVISWGWSYLSTVLDDFSRYILAWKLCTTMIATDVSDTLAMACAVPGWSARPGPAAAAAPERQRASYLSAQLGSWLGEHGKPYDPMTQGKIERATTAP